jgi:hypothetical protein
LQRVCLIQQFRPLAFFAAATIDDPDIVETVTKLNSRAGSPDEEVFRPSVLKNAPALTVEDMRELAVWMTEHPKVFKNDLIKHLQAMQLRRWAIWHIFCPDNPNIHHTLGMSQYHVSRISFISSAVHNDTVEQLCRLVKLDALTCGNIGGSVFKELKANPDKRLTWETLSVAKLWNDEKYSVVRDILKAEVEVPAATDEQQVDGDGGGLVNSLRITGADAEMKTVCWGPPVALLTQKRAHAVFIETDSHGMSADLPGALSRIKDVRIVVFGAVANVRVALEQLMDPELGFKNYNVAEVHCFLKEDPPNGARPAGAHAVHRQAMLLSPGPLPPRWPYAVQPTNLNVTLIGHLLKCLDIQAANNAFNNAVLICSVSRPWHRVAELAADQGTFY